MKGRLQNNQNSAAFDSVERLGELKKYISLQLCTD